MQIATKYSIIIIIIYGMKRYAMQYKKYKNQAVVNLHINQGPTVTLMSVSYTHLTLPTTPYV